MLLKENEAKNTRCCGPGGCGDVRDGARYCIGSACMAWRWDGYSVLTQSNTADEFIPSDGKGPPTLRQREPDGGNWRQVWPKDQRQWFGWTNWERPNYENATGSCGLAPDERFSQMRQRLETAERELSQLKRGSRPFAD